MIPPAAPNTISPWWKQTAYARANNYLGLQNRARSKNNAPASVTVRDYKAATQF